MNINPMMLFPLLLGMNGENGNMDAEKMTSFMSAIQKGDISPILQMLGGNNDKMSGMLSMFKMIPSLMNINKNNSQSSEVTQSAEKSNVREPNLKAVSSLTNNEINSAIYNLLKNK